MPTSTRRPLPNMSRAAVCLVALLGGVGLGCAPAETAGGGTGGVGRTGGATGSGGSLGSGGATMGTGGGVASGGVTGTGGASASGGNTAGTGGGGPGSGGAIATGGSGGTNSGGGRGGSGGTLVGTGGNGVGGNVASTGGASGTGGSGTAGGGGSMLDYLTTWYRAMDASKGTVDLFADHISYLRGEQATMTGLSVYYVDSGKTYHGGYVQDWNAASDKFEWPITSPIAGNYYVSALINQTNGATVSITVGSNTLTHRLTASGWDKVDLGQITVPMGSTKLAMTASGSSFNMQFKTLELIPASAKAAVDAEIVASKSKATWMKTKPLGMMYQWGNWGGNPDGSSSAWPGCYQKMNWANFAQRVQDQGADFVVWSITWTQFYVAAPIASIDAILAGRTSQVDYLDTILTEFQKRNIKVIFYYHLGHDNNPNLNWWNAFWTVPAAGVYARREATMNRWINIITEIGNRYGSKLAGWMFDDGRVYFPAPFHKLAAAARAGNPDRMVSFNPWVLPRYSDFEDFAFGEGATGAAGAISNGIYTNGKQKGQQAFGNFQTEAGDWGVRKGDTSISTTMSQSQFNSIAADGVNNMIGKAFNFRMFENGTQGQTTLDRFKSAAAAAR